MNKDLIEVLHITNSVTGGAGKAVYRLHKSLNQQNSLIHSRILVKEGHTSQNDEIYSYQENALINKSEFAKKKYPINKRYKNWIKAIYSKINRKEQFWKRRRQILSEANKSTETFSDIYSAYELDRHPLVLEADLIHFHWVGFFLDWPKFFLKTPKDKQFFWTLHDFGPFTGGYHYPMGYWGYVENERDCPFLKDTSWPDYASFILGEKERILVKNNINIHVIAPSYWLKQKSESSRLFRNYEHTLIRNSVPSDKYYPEDQILVRRNLGLPKTGIILLFVSEELNNKRKGMDLLFKTLKLIAGEKIDISICSVGKGNINEQIPESIPYFEYGYVEDESVMRNIYNASSALVIPSKEDNLPNTVLESLMSGTPVISFPVGGILEVINNPELGVIAKDVSIESFSNAIVDFCESVETFDKSEISKIATKRFHPEIQAEAMGKAYLNSIRETYGT